MTPLPEPVTCALNDQEAEAQALEWVDLQRLALRISPLATGVQMTFPAAHSTSILDLAERETTCCGFLDIATSSDGNEFVIEITSENPEAFGVIAALGGVKLS